LQHGGYQDVDAELAAALRASDAEASEQTEADAGAESTG